MPHLDASGLSANSVVLHDAERRRWLWFQQPVQVLRADMIDQVLPVLTAAQQATQQGYYVAGFVGYEAAPAFDRSFAAFAPKDFPLAWFGVYAQPEEVTLPEAAEPPILLDWQPSISEQRYYEAIEQIKRYIAQGNTYQVNFSFRLRAECRADPWRYFSQLIRGQEGLYGAFVCLEDWAVCCASPELFFQLRDRQLTCRPMKGTAPRGLTRRDDRSLAEGLQRSEKNRAENLMIVDMIRNDMGRIAQIGSVRVQALFALEQYPTVWQMTSPVTCHTDAAWAGVFEALFPCASITGAPKPRTTQIIAALEDAPRQIYTGAIGFVEPNGAAQFNVAIRTVLIDRAKQTAEYGVGGGIVWDSLGTEEYQECCTKAKLLTQRQPAFSLLETLLWTPEAGYFLLDRHLARLQASAAYFAFTLDLAAVSDRLQAVAATFERSPYRVRLLAAKQGEVQLEAQPFTAQPEQRLQVCVAQSPIDSADVFLHHKTTHRAVYEQAKQLHPGFDDVLLWNDRGELTEACTANLIVEWNGEWYTPPVSCGLLAGTFREWLLDQGKVRERIIRVTDLPQCSRIFLVNSVRQMQEAVVKGYPCAASSGL